MKHRHQQYRGEQLWGSDIVGPVNGSHNLIEDGSDELLDGIFG